MGLSPDALFSQLVDDLSVYVGRDYCDFIARNQHLPLHADATPVQAFCYSLLKSFYKKFIDRTSGDADRLALDKFRLVNLRCLNWRLEDVNMRDEEILNLLKKEIDDFLHPAGEALVPSYFSLLEKGRTGPGASLGASGFDFYTKLFSSTLTSTARRRPQCVCRKRLLRFYCS